MTRSFDGLRLAWDDPTWNITLTGARPTQGGFEVSANPELDVTLAGAAVTVKRIPSLPPLDARLFYVYYRDDRDHPLKVDNRPQAVRAADHDAIALHTIGGHVVSVVDFGAGRLDFLAWVAGQLGDWGVDDQRAWAFAIESGSQWPTLVAAPWLRVGWDRSSGDGDPNDRRHQTFFQLLPTARTYAQFPFYNLMNGSDAFLELLLTPIRDVSVRCDYHWLGLGSGNDLWYSGGGATNSTIFGYAGAPADGHRDLAQVVDVSASVRLLPELTVGAYYGHAFGGDVVRATFAGTAANYGFLEATYRR